MRTSRLERAINRVKIIKSIAYDGQDSHYLFQIAKAGLPRKARDTRKTANVSAHQALLDATQSNLSSCATSNRRIWLSNGHRQSIFGRYHFTHHIPVQSQTAQLFTLEQCVDHGSVSIDNG